MWPYLRDQLEYSQCRGAPSREVSGHLARGPAEASDEGPFTRRCSWASLRGGRAPAGIAYLVVAELRRDPGLENTLLVLSTTETASSTGNMWGELVGEDLYPEDPWTWQRRSVAFFRSQNMVECYITAIVTAHGGFEHFWCSVNMVIPNKGLTASDQLWSSGRLLARRVDSQPDLFFARFPGITLNFKQ